MTVCEHDRLVEMYLTGLWTRTRDMVTYRCVLRADRLLELIDHVTEFDEKLIGCIDAEIGHVITQAIGRPLEAHMMTPRQRAIWDAAVAVCPDRDKLVQEIKKDPAVRGLNPNVTCEQALSQLLKTHLDARRREAAGITEHEDRVWAKLRQISDDLIREYQAKHGRSPPRGYRCSPEHFREIRVRILRDEPDDQRVGKIKSSTIEVYFGRFCDECRHLVSLESASETSHPGEPWGNGVLVLPPSLTKALPLLKKCIDRLDARMRDVIHAAYFEKPKVVILPPQRPGGRAECRGREALGEGECERLRKEALRQLRMCLDLRMSEETR